MKHPFLSLIAMLIMSVSHIATAQWGSLGEIHVTPASPNANGQVTLRISGEKNTPCHVVNDEVIVNDQDISVQLSITRNERVSAACPQVVVPFNLSLPLGSLPEGDYQVTVSLAGSDDTLAANFSVSERQARLQLSPPTGEYASTQTFDMAIMVDSVNSPIVDGEVLLGLVGTPRSEWQDVTPDVLECIIPGQLEQGQVLRCPELPAALFGPGKHQVHARVILENGKVLQGTAVWEVLSSNEE